MGNLDAHYVMLFVSCSYAECIAPKGSRTLLLTDKLYSPDEILVFRLVSAWAVKAHFIKVIQVVCPAPA